MDDKSVRPLLLSGCESIAYESVQCYVEGCLNPTLQT